MRIAGLASRPPAADDVATALERAVALLGQRPAITSLGEGGRREQGFASLAGWVAKGANLLTAELGLGPGSRIVLAGPPGWPLATVALSAWWIGATIVPLGTQDGGPADLRVLHGALGAAGIDPAAETFWFGDALDGSTTSDVSSGEQWTDAVTPHGDRPPPPARDGALTALHTDGADEVRQGDLLAPLATDEGGALGLIRSMDDDLLTGADAARRLALLALRPLVTGSATVVLERQDPERDAHARAERIVRWEG